MNRRDRQRKSPRLQGYDYSNSGVYFVTICTHNRQHIFGSINNGNMMLSAMGHIASACWDAIPDHFPSVELDVSIVMPNHVHGIIVLPGGGATLGTIIGNYKAAVTRLIRRLSSIEMSSAGPPVGPPSVGTPSVGTPVRTPSVGPPSVGTPYMASVQAALQGKIWQARYHDHIIRNERSLRRIQEYIVNNPARWREDSLFTPDGRDLQ